MKFVVNVPNSIYNALESDDVVEVFINEDELPPVTPLKSLGEEMRIIQKGITDEKVLLGFNMAVALCNKHLGGDDNE